MSVTQMGGRLVRMACLALVLGLMPTLASGGAALAQSDLERKVEQLEKQLRAVQREIFDNDSPYFRDDTADGDAAAFPAGPVGRPALLADLSARMDSLEAELGRLTGRIEELQFANRQLKDTLERFRKDADLRFQALERGGLAGTPGFAGAAAADDSGDARPQDAAAPAETASERADAPTSALPEGSPQDQYDHAFGLLRRGAFAEAETAFGAFLDRHPQHALAGNAQYWLGESFYVRQMYPRAAQAFLNGFETYGDSAKAPDNLLKLGMTLGALGQTGEACDALDELDRRFPDAEARIRDRMAAERARLDCSR